MTFSIVLSFKSDSFWLDFYEQIGDSLDLHSLPSSDLSRRPFFGPLSPVSVGHRASESRRFMRVTLHRMPVSNLIKMRASAFKAQQRARSTALEAEDYRAVRHVMKEEYTYLKHWLGRRCDLTPKQRRRLCKLNRKRRQLKRELHKQKHKYNQDAGPGRR